MEVRQDRMATTIIFTLGVLLIFCALLAIGQFFGREPITPKCNPDTCCMKGEGCDRRESETRRKAETGEEG